ncbi:MAG: lipoyl synthase [Deltaproteobacteria bacterium]|nr:lipoyl synthase [Deltaproteobacteria bacterium]
MNRIAKPPWLRVKIPSGETHARVKALIRAKSLHTVCEEAKCPNLAECWGAGTATFLILGDRCSRRCKFCSVKSMDGSEAIPAGCSAAEESWEDEVVELARAVVAMGLKHVVVTSVTRDDLSDGGAGAFAQVLRTLRSEARACTVELLVPDFMGDRRSIATVIGERPDIFGHNVETVPRLYSSVRPQAQYRRSLLVLAAARELEPSVVTKSGFMVGLGENRQEVRRMMEDLLAVGCQILTIGQYLRPGKIQLPVVRYYKPEEFLAMREEALQLGFRWVESGPLVRSSYRAETQAAAVLSQQQRL